MGESETLGNGSPMPEVERKVLRDMLLRIKEKVLHSRNRSLESIKRSTEFLSKISEARLKLKGSESQEAKTLDQWLNYTELYISSLIETTMSVIEDSNMYIDLLETLAVEYDKTLVAYLKKLKREIEEKRGPPAAIYA